MYRLSSITEPLGRDPLEYLFNVGHPSVRTETVWWGSTVLGDPDISISWPRREMVGLKFKEGAIPLRVIETLLKKEGFRSPEELRHEFEIPRVALTCRKNEISINRGFRPPGVVVADSDDPKTVLRHALILGLCGPTFYDPNKAVIWTNNRLSRRLFLFEPEGWYADK